MMRKKILTLAIFVGATLLLTATGVLAASPAASNPHPILQEPTAPPAITATTGITNPVAIAIADFFSSVVFTPTYTVTVQSVLALHASGMGYGEIATALFVAHASGLPFDQIMAMRGQEEGGGWGYIIKKELGLDIRRRDTNLGAIMSGRAVTETQTMSGTVGTRGRGPKETPPGWDLGNGLGLGRGHGRGHNK